MKAKLAVCRAKGEVSGHFQEVLGRVTWEDDPITRVLRAEVDGRSWAQAPAQMIWLRVSLTFRLPPASSQPPTIPRSQRTTSLIRP